MKRFQPSKLAAAAVAYISGAGLVSHSKSDAMENAILLLVCNNTNWANIGDATGLRGSTVAGFLYWALFTADPGEAGTAVTNETAYTGYARIAAARSGAALVVTGNSVSPAANVDFVECSASPGGNLTHFGLVSTSSGAGILLWSGAFNVAITMAVGTIPRIKPTTTITED